MRYASIEYSTNQYSAMTNQKLIPFTSFIFTYFPHAMQIKQKCYFFEQ